MKIIATTEPDTRRIETTIEALPENPERILDVGCVRHNRAKRAWGNLHASLHSAYPEAEIVGVDVDSEEVERMSAPGYTIREQDCETMDLARLFDAIVAGEVIEHLSNPGKYLERAEYHLRKGGRIVLTTPNPDCLRYSLKAKTGQWTSADHTCWVDPQQLGTLVNRSTEHLEVKGIEYMNYTRLPSWFGERLRAKSYRAVIA